MTGSCATCAAILSTVENFCGRCGAARQPSAAVTASPGASDQSAGERRQVTALFADLVDSTRLSQVVDADEYAEAVLAYQDSGREAITALGGHVAVYLGDGILGLFGYPIAYEDNALRAVRAGLTLLERLEHLRSQHPTVAMVARVGLHTGLAIVGARRSPDRTDTAVFGDTINIASRIEGEAPHGSLAVSDVTFRLIERYVDAQCLGTHDLKGVLTPMGVHQVTGLRDAARAAGFATPFVGRARELAALSAIWSSVESGGSAMAFVRGEAGMGKSRLVAEFESRLGPRGGRIWHASCSPTAVHEAFHPFLKMIEKLAGATHESSSTARADQLDRALRTWGINDVGIRSTLGLAVAGAIDELDPEALRASVRRSLLGLFTRLSSAGAAAVVVDDLHWADPSTMELLSELSTDLPPHLLVLTTLRPEGAPDGLRLANVAVIDVAPLPAAEAQQVAQAAAGDNYDDARIRQIVERCDGVPLYLEEMTKAARIEPALAVPTTLHDSLATRLDRLGSARHAANVAAVFGREFSRRRLIAVMDTPDAEESVGALIESGMVRAATANNGSLTFAHALIQEAAYSSLLKTDRRKLHARVAGHMLADTDAFRADEIAFHLAGGGRPLESTGWYLKAGRTAAARAAYREAMGHLGQGLAVLEAVEGGPDRDALELDIQLLIGNAAQAVSGFTAEGNDAVWTRAVELAARLANLDEQTSAMNGLWAFWYNKGDLSIAQEIATDIVGLSEAGNSRVGRMRGYSSLSAVTSDAGDHRLAFEYARRAVAQCRPGDFELVSYGMGIDQNSCTYGMAGTAAWFVGEDRLALDWTATATELANERNLASVTIAQTFRSLTMWLRRSDDWAIQAAADVLRVAEQLGAPRRRGYGLLVMGAATARATRGREGLDMIQESRDLMRRASSLRGAALGCSILAEAWLVLGEPHEALRTADLGLRYAELSRQHAADPELLRIRAASRLAVLRADGDHHNGGFEAAVRELVEAARLARVTGSLPQELRAMLDLTNLHLEMGHTASTTDLRDVVERVHPDDTSPDRASAEALLRDPLLQAT